MKIDLAGKKVLILGASKGLGEHLAFVLAGYNCEIFLVARNENKLLEIREIINKKTAICYHASLDLLKDESVQRLYDRLIADNFIPDIMIHNLGGAIGMKDPMGNRQSFMDVWNFNVGIQIELNSLLIPHMKENKWGRIVSISSVLSLNGGMPLSPYGGSIQYNAAKAYLNSYNKSLSRELAEDNIVVSTVMPGVLLSEGKYWSKLMVSNPELVEQFLEAHVSTKRFGTYEDLSPFILLLCSDLASYCSGLEVNIDGGWK
jgi:3-oxoacyl-[acyl-carrier protein] reductase